MGDGSVVQEKGTGKAGGTGIIEKVVTTGRLSGQLRCCEQALENAGWDIQKNYDLNVRIKVGFSTEGGGKNWGDSPLIPLFEKNRGGDERKGVDEELTPRPPLLEGKRGGRQEEEETRRGNSPPGPLSLKEREGEGDEREEETRGEDLGIKKPGENPGLFYELCGEGVRVPSWSF